MKTVLRNWNIMRGLRLALGIFAIVQAFTQKDTVLGIIGGFLLFTALANIGCCGSNGCVVNYKTKQNNKEIEYEELDSKQ